MSGFIRIDARKEGSTEPVRMGYAKLVHHNIILVSGNAPRAGKSTVAKALCDFWGSKCYETHDPIYRVAYGAGWDGKRDNKGRKLLQDIGLAGKTYDPDIWARKLYLDIFHATDKDLDTKTHGSGPDNWYFVSIVAGIRSIAEMEFFKNNSNNCCSIIVTRDDDIVNKKASKHKVENMLPSVGSFDYEIHNNMTGIDKLVEDTNEVGGRILNEWKEYSEHE